MVRMAAINIDEWIRIYFIPAERLGSGDGERKTSLTQQIAFEPLPASVLFGLALVYDAVIVSCHSQSAIPQFL